MGKFTLKRIVMTNSPCILAEYEVKEGTKTPRPIGRSRGVNKKIKQAPSTSHLSEGST